MDTDTPNVSYWEYRIVYREYPDETPFYAIYEVYFDEANNPVLNSEEPAWPMGVTIDELRQDCELYLRAMTQPALNYSEFDEATGSLKEQ